MSNTTSCWILPRLSQNEAMKLIQKLKESGELEIKDRQYRFSKYEQCFIGSELVDWLIKYRGVVEAEAIALGQSLLEHNLLAHVHHEHDFKNEFLFYYFIDQESSKTDLPQLSFAEAKQLVQELQSNPVFKIKDRRYRLIRYKQCFVGSELVDCLVKSRNITPEAAIALGQSLFKHNLIAHVCDDHEFENEFLFYRFQRN